MLIIGDELYFVQFNRGSISKINLKTGVNDNDVEIVAPGLNHPIGLVYYKDYLYISELGNDYVSKNDKISRLNIKEANTQLETFVDSLTLPNGMKIIDDFLYFSSSLEKKGAVYKVDLKKSNPRPEKFVGNLDYPTGLELYLGELYIIESGFDKKISKIDLNDISSGVKDVMTKDKHFSNLGSNFHMNSRPVFIQDHIYFSSAYNNSVYKFNLTKTNAKPEYVTGSYYLGRPSDLLFINKELYISHDSGIIKYNLSSTLNVNEFSLNELTLYPNPTANILNFKGLKEDTAITVYNSIGQQVAQQKLAFNESLNVAHLAKGIYFLKFANINGLVKFVKQ